MPVQFTFLQGGEIHQEESEVDKEEHKTGFPKPEMAIRELHHRKSLDDHISLFDLDRHSRNDSLQFCSNGQDYLPLSAGESDELLS